MGFASSWLKERALFPELIKEAPSANTGIIVVVPSYDEPEITDLLDSLDLCARTCLQSRSNNSCQCSFRRRREILKKNAESILKTEKRGKKSIPIVSLVFL